MPVKSTVKSGRDNNFMNDFIRVVLDNSRCIIPTFLVAILISAVLTETLPQKFFEKILGHKNLFFVFLASFFGALIPLCTCGMIPLASKLQKKGASWLIVVSFLTAGNASSITALFMTGVLGLKITILRFLFAVIFGIFVSYVFVLIFKPVPSISDDEKHCVEALHAMSLPIKIFREFKGLLFCFGLWILAAIVLGTIISLYVRASDIIKIVGVNNIFSPFILLLSSFPFYFCAGSDIPISKSLIEKGAGLGSVLAFMTASPGVNFTSFMVYQKWLGIKNAVVYLIISILVCGGMGIVVNMIL